MTTRLAAWVLPLLFLLGLAPAAPAHAQEIPSLLSGRMGAAQVPVNGDASRIAVTRYREVQVDREVLDSALNRLTGRPGSTQQIRIPFFNDRNVVVTLNRVERLGRGVTNFYGTVDGDEL